MLRSADWFAKPDITGNSNGSDHDWYGSDFHICIHNSLPKGIKTITDQVSI